MSRDDNYTNVILEDINSKFDALIEITDLMKTEMKTLAKQEDLEEVKADVKVIKAVLTDLTGQVDDHESRITTLETA